ncbi:MAG: CDP-diacylglycerol--glycerol-3-phosphate 3-phosphatidyltransferase [Planctomycetia bacterium]|nr:CDP-diacylglycerol--glycerol-3-phosphate 3-phosphatidyltransferase [Planctomycetia bacterium]
MSNSDSSQKETKPSSKIWNVPNILTMGRIILALVMFVVIPFKCYWAAMILFIVAAGTDWLDGWWARKFNQVSKLGRIMDPLADKLIVCGAFIYLVAIPDLQIINLPRCACNWGLAPWMVVVIVLRELIVTVIRSAVESSGGDFSAKWLGKCKMLLQCIAIPACFLYLIVLHNTSFGQQPPRWLILVLITSLWGTVVLSVYSCVQYIIAAARFAAKSDD